MIIMIINCARVGWPVVVHPRDHAMVIGTHRGAWIIDDVPPLRALGRDEGLRGRIYGLYARPMSKIQIGEHACRVSHPLRFLI